jgi:aminopeptidase N
MDFQLGAAETTITTTMQLSRNAGLSAAETDLVLDGEEIELLSLSVGGAALGTDDYEVLYNYYYYYYYYCCCCCC